MEALTEFDEFLDSLSLDSTEKAELARLVLKVSDSSWREGWDDAKMDTEKIGDSPIDVLQYRV